MTIGELDAVFREASWLIAKRSGRTAKALTIGSESLERTIVDIADLYDLTPAERRILRPAVADDVQKGVSKVVNVTKSAVGVGATAMDATKVAKAAQSAWRTGRVGRTLVTIATHGPKAAQTFANTGRLVGKFNPVVLGLTLAWTAGSTGWFAYHANGFNKAAYALRRRTIDAGSS